MAKSDEEKVKAALDQEVEEPKAPAEPEAQPAEPAQDDEPEEQPAPPEEDQDKPDEAPEGTFTKPEGYEWVKGDNLEEFNQNLLVAYENSTAEALRLRQSAQAPAPAAAPAADQPPAPAIDPAVAYAQSMMQRDMVDSFNDFAKKFPQAREPQSFDQFEKASNGASQAFATAYGRVPTYPELFEATANLLGWQASGKTALKDAAIKDAAVSTATTSQSQAPPKAAKVNSKTIEIMRRIPGNQDKSDSELVKELQPFIT